MAVNVVCRRRSLVTTASANDRICLMCFLSYLVVRTAQANCRAENDWTLQYWQFEADSGYMRCARKLYALLAFTITVVYA
jgi:hypothetical protein